MPFPKTTAMAFACLLFFSCRNFYKVSAPPALSLENKQTAISENLGRKKYFILRDGENSYAMSDLQIDQQKQTLSCLLNTLPPEHRLYVTKDKKQKDRRYKKYRPEKVVLQEVHLYTKLNIIADTVSRVNLALDNIQKIEVIEFDKGRTTTSYVLGGIGYTLAGMAVVGIIVALTKSSCPFVSVYDGHEYQVQAELFGGAIYPSLERKDFVPLKAEPINGTYTIRITNELQEKQYTNFARLMVITHDKEVDALSDPDGKIYTIGHLTPPFQAVLNDEQDLTASVAQTDAMFCGFNGRKDDPINTLKLRFKKTAEQKNAKLVLHLKNSYWFDFLYGQFTSAFGSYYPKWIRQQKKMPAQDLEKWSLDQKIPMNISVKTKTGWKDISNLKTIGPLTHRKIVVPLDFADNNSNELEVKLSTGFMFWELDYAGIDYSSQSDYQVDILDPFAATDEKGNNVLPDLSMDDQHYLDQPKPGNTATLQYKWTKPTESGKATTVILLTKGYYEHVRNYKGKPRISFLKSFRNPGAMAAFSREQFEKANNHYALKN